jgi:hypothetical protein
MIMRNHSETLEIIANDFLEQNCEIDPTENPKPNYSNRDFMNAVIIFQTALMDKMFDNMDFDKMDLEERYKMAQSSGEELRKLIHTYTGLDTHKIEEFL